MRSRRAMGFTLVELLVVIIIIAVLLLIALVMFKSITGKARQADAINTLQQASIALQERAADTGRFTDPATLANDLKYDNPQLCVGTGGSWSSALNPCPSTGKTKNFLVIDTNSNAGGITSYASSSDGTVVEMVTGPGGQQQTATITDLAGKTPTNVSKPLLSGVATMGQSLTVVPGGWLSKDDPTFSYQWQRSANGSSGWADISGATSASYVVQDADLTSYLRAVVTATNSAGSTSADSASSSQVAYDASTATPSGETQPQITTSPPTQGQAASATPGTWTNSPVSYDYQWRLCDASGLNCADIAGASGTDIPASPSPTFSYTPVLSDVGQTLRIQVTAKTSDGFQGVSQSDASQAVAGSAPANGGGSDAPVIGGTVATGQTVNVSNGTWTNNPTSYSYQWQRCLNGTCTDIGAATSANYTIADSDFGYQLKAKVTASNAYGSATMTTDPTAPVSGTAPIDNTLPTISGTVKDGQTVSGSNGTWTGTATITYSYQWQSSPDNSTWSSIGGATATTYAIPYGTYPKYLRIKVTASNPVGTTSAYSLGSAVAATAPSNTAVPVVTGTAKDGQTLSTSNGSWTGTPTISYSYQWQTSATGTSGWSNLSGATASTYVVQTSDIGNYLRAQVTASNPGGAATASSAATAKVIAIPVSNTVAPSFSGSAQDGQTLTGSKGSWVGSPTISYSYQWQRSANGTSGWAAIGGATSINYTLTSSDYNNYVELCVTGSDPWSNATKCSAASAKITALPPSNTSAPTVSGSASVGSTLSSTTGSWSGTPTISYSYQWQTSPDGSTGWSSIGGATSSSYVISSADTGNYLRVQVTASNGGGSASAQSAATAQVISSMPVGAVVPYAGSGLPSGWLVADGSAVSRTTYSALFAVIGTTYGAGDGSTTFNLPDLRGSFVLGKASSGTGSALGASGGALDQTGNVNPWGTINESYSWSETVPDPAGVAHTHAPAATGLSPMSNNQWPNFTAWRSVKDAGTGCCALSGTYVDKLASATETWTAGTVSGLSASASLTPTASYSVSNPPYVVVSYIIRASAAASTSPCGALYGFGAAALPSGGGLADGATTSSCLNAAFSGVLPDLRGALPLGQAASGSYSALAASGGSIDQTVSGTLTAAATQAAVTPASWTASLTEGTHTHSYSGQTVTSGSGGNAMGTYGASSSAPGVTSNSNAGTVYTSASYAPGTLTEPGAGTQSPVSGTFNTAFQTINWFAYNGSSYTLDTGDILAYPGAVAPSGWLIADGAAVSRTTYSTLFAVIGTTYGAGDGSTTFNLPDMRGRFALGTATSGTGSTLAASGGSLAPTPTLSFTGWTPQITIPGHTFSWSVPTHTHKVTWYGSNSLGNAGGFIGEVRSPGTGTSGGGGGGTINSSVTGYSVSGAAIGAGNASPAVSPPPFVALNYLIKD